MGRTKLLVLIVCGLGVAALVSSIDSSDATIPTPSAVELKPSAQPVTSTNVPPVAPSKDAAAIARTEDPARAAIAKAPARVNRREQPAAVTVTAERREDALPPSAPAVKVPPARVTYEQRVAAAITAAGEDPNRALLELQLLAKGEPGRPEAYEAMAGISLRKRDYDQARELIDSAFVHGGKATFRIIHDHSRGNFDAGDPKTTCVGELTIQADEVRFESPGNGDRFAATWSEVRDAGSNRFFGSGRGGFHVSIDAGGKYKNFNLAPESKDKAEAKLILDLLTAYRSDRTK